MCDYSLAEYKNRLAVKGEDLVLAMFATGTKGFISAADWQAIGLRYSRELCAVCLAPGSRLRVMATDTILDACVTFVQTSMEAGRHRDAVQLPDGRITNLQCLPAGTKATVLSVGGEDPEPEPEPLEVQAERDAPVPELVAMAPPSQSGIFRRVDWLD